MTKARVRTRVFTGASGRRVDHDFAQLPREKRDTMSVTTETSGATAIRPFQVEFPDEALDDLRRRVTATRLPSKELVGDRSQGVQLATLQALARYWTTDYDWRR